MKSKKIPYVLSEAYYIARYSYLNARRVFGNYNRKFYIYCSYEYTIKQQYEDEIRQYKGTTTKYKNDKLNDFIEDLESQLKPGECEYYDLFKLIWHFLF